MCNTVRTWPPLNNIFSCVRFGPLCLFRLCVYKVLSWCVLSTAVPRGHSGHRPNRQKTGCEWSPYYTTQPHSTSTSKGITSLFVLEIGSQQIPNTTGYKEGKIMDDWMDSMTDQLKNISQCYDFALLSLGIFTFLADFFSTVLLLVLVHPSC